MIPFPGGTSVSLLRVYDWPAPDGIDPDGRAGAGGGSPHLHTASSEGYVVIGGSGAVQTLGADGCTETVLEPGVVAWFTPGVVHRLINHGDLEILVVMSNAGLPEAGDAVLTVPPDVLADAERYRAATTLPSIEDAGEEVVARSSRARRDLALNGYADLRSRVEADGPGALADLHAAAARLVAGRASAWQQIWSEILEPIGAGTAAALADLADGRGPHLADGRFSRARTRPGPERFGMCGRLRTWPI